MKKTLFSEVRACNECKTILPLKPNPILQHSIYSSVCIIGQAPGIKAHESSIPWNDPSGDRLRIWLGINKDSFYDQNKMTILPMSFCYPGKGKSGDKPPIKICAPLWHKKLLAATKPKLIFLVGKYAQDYYLSDSVPLTVRLKDWEHYLPKFIVLPHPSPRNNIWLKKNSWFEDRVLPEIQYYLKINPCYSRLRK